MLVDGVNFSVSARMRSPESPKGRRSVGYDSAAGGPDDGSFASRYPKFVETEYIQEQSTAETLPCRDGHWLPASLTQV